MKLALKEFFGRIGLTRKRQPVDSVDTYLDFLATRSAMVGQKKLYEYVKTRMGMSYPKAFEDPVFIESLNIAKWHVYAACISDLSIWMAARVFAGSATSEEAARISIHGFARTLDEKFEQDFLKENRGRLVESFSSRVAMSDWKAKSAADAAFTLSPKELVHWAPIAPRLKQYDEEIVENSIRFAWIAVMEEFLNLFNYDSFIADWRNSEPTGDREA